MSEEETLSNVSVRPGSCVPPTDHVGGCCDITVTRDFWGFLEDGYDRSERCHQVTLIRCDWTSVESTNRQVTHTTRWKLHVCAPNAQHTDEREVLRLIGCDTFTHLHHFADRLWKEHDTELLYIQRGLIFVFQHRQYSKNKMDELKRNILMLFQHLINRPAANSNFDVSLDVLEEKSGSDKNGTSSLSSTELQLQRIEVRLQEQMSVHNRNMENVVCKMIQKHQTYMEGKLQNIALAVSSQRNTTNMQKTVQRERDITPGSTEQDSHVHGENTTLEEPFTPGGTPVDKQAVPETTEIYPDADVTDEGNDKVLEEIPGSPIMGQTTVPTTVSDDTWNGDTSVLSLQTIQQTTSSEIISKNYYEAQQLLSTLNINLDGWKRLTESTALALEVAHPSPPRTNAAVTVLCVDVSESVGESGLGELKEFANRFIDGIETMAEQHGLEENIGVVAMGGDVSVVQELTNDYGRVRDTIDDLVLRGTSPMFEAIVVSVASIRNRAGVLRIGGIHKVKPRIIFLTDGFATSEDQSDGPDTAIHDSNLKVQIVRLTTVLAREKSDTVPLLWVPVGNADKSFLSSLARLGNQELVEGKDIHSLCNRYRLQDTIAKIYICLEKTFSEDKEGIERNIDAVAGAFMGDMTHEEKVTVIQAVKEKIQTKDTKLPDDGPSDYDNVLERKGLPPLGSRVIRGPDWKYGDQDVEGPGTVVNHANDHQFLWVQWDLSYSNCRYRYGYEEHFDVLLIDQPRRLATHELIEIGVKVKRGVDWSYADQDGGPDGRGIVIRKRKDGRVKVRWDNGHINSYYFGGHGKFDLEVSTEEDELSAVIAASLEETASPPREHQDEDVRRSLQTDDRPYMVWQWKDDDGNWRLYTQKQIEKLEREYVRKSARSCVLQKGGQSFRVTFKEPMSQKSSEDGRKCEVQRLAVSAEDRDQLICQTSAVEDVGWMWMEGDHGQQ
ncbi:uncharacterized protein [Haliotis cracherodii]|uniref:uncharacterized protein n=1 Tax=Haliotis cracherodii TaxID=6455 RepID=UPI0039E8C626